MDVRWRPLLVVAIVSRFVTQPPWRRRRPLAGHTQDRGTTVRCLGVADIQFRLDALGPRVQARRPLLAKVAADSRATASVVAVDEVLLPFHHPSKTTLCMIASSPVLRRATTANAERVSGMRVDSPVVASLSKLVDRAKGCPTGATACIYPNTDDLPATSARHQPRCRESD